MSLSTITMSGHRCSITQLVWIFTSQSNLTFSLSNTGSTLLLPKRDYVMLGSLLSQIRLSSVMFVRPTQGVETFGNISSPFCTLAILWRWPQHKILPRLSQGNPCWGRYMQEGQQNKAMSHLSVSSPDEFLLLLITISENTPIWMTVYENGARALCAINIR